MASKRELIAAIAARYHEAGRVEKKTILDELIEVTGFSSEARDPCIETNKAGTIRSGTTITYL